MYYEYYIVEGRYVPHGADSYDAGNRSVPYDATKHHANIAAAREWMKTLGNPVHFNISKMQVNKVIALIGVDEEVLEVNR
jgi:hypothetical protein